MSPAGVRSSSEGEPWRVAVFGTVGVGVHPHHGCLPGAPHGKHGG